MRDGCLRNISADMKFIVIIIIIVVLIFTGLSLLDYFGYYIDWDRSILSLAVIIPIAVAIKSFITNPMKVVKKISKKMDEE